jgi:hypothetical protein
MLNIIRRALGLRASSDKEAQIGPTEPVSDARRKEDICQIGESASGIPLYHFRYRGQEGLYEGVMAQDLLQTRPDAVVVGPDGFYRVDYDKLGIEFRRLQ